jgi:hypothetical protein
VLTPRLCHWQRFFSLFFFSLLIFHDPNWTQSASERQPARKARIRQFGLDADVPVISDDCIRRCYGEDWAEPAPPQISPGQMRYHGFAGSRAEPQYEFATWRDVPFQCKCPRARSGRPFDFQLPIWAIVGAAVVSVAVLIAIGACVGSHGRARRQQRQRHR